jgi:hypothetical protein
MVHSSLTLLGAGRYVHWGVIQISLTNLLIIVGMVLLFIAAILVPFPRPGQQRPDRSDARRGQSDERH